MQVNKSNDRIAKLKIKSAFKIFLVYLILGGLWIAFSDMLLGILFPDPLLASKLQTPKGLFFVIVTGLILYFLVRKDVAMADKLLDNEYNSRVAAEKAKLQLEESEKKYKLLFFSNPSPMWLYDLETLKFLDVNEVAIKNYGYSREEFLSMTIKDIRPDEDIPKLLDNIKNAQYGVEYSTDWRHKRKDGTIIYVDIRSNAIEYQGRKSKFVTAIDISKRIKAEEALKASTEKLRAFFDSNLIGILFGDIHGSVSEANDEFLRIIGYSRLELEQGKIRWNKITPPEFLKLDSEKVEEALAKGVCEPYEKQYIRKDGSHVWVLVAFILVGEQRENSVAYILDLTKLKEAELRQKELNKKNEELLKMLQIQIDHMPVGYLITDKDFKITFWNPAAEKIFGYSAKEIIGQKPYNFILSESQKPFIDDRRKLWSKGIKNAHSINENITKNGRNIICDWINTPILDENGKFKELVSMVIDITERINSEEEIKRQREELRALASYLQSVREKERIAISRELHDELGQILTSVKMNLIIMSKEMTIQLKDHDTMYFDNEIKSMTTLLDKSVQSVRKIISYLRPEALTNLSLIEAIEWQIHEFNKIPGIKGSFFNTCPAIRTDDEFNTSVFRIIQEALTNVRRHSGATEVKVKFSCKSNFLTLSVKDNGKGIDNVEKLRTKSFGLLGIRERAILLGGKSEIFSKPGDGTELVVTIPLSQSTPINV